jgi:hypothetical protein
MFLPGTNLPAVRLCGSGIGRDVFVDPRNSCNTGHRRAIYRKESSTTVVTTLDVTGSSALVAPAVAGQVEPA